MAASSKSQNLAGDNIKLLCSFGGVILPAARSCDGHPLRYVGGDTRLVRVNRSIPFQDSMKKLEDLFGVSATMLKCKLPKLDLDVLVSVTSDEDLQNVVEEYEKYNSSYPFGGRMRSFLFPLKPSPAADEIQARQQTYFERLAAQNSAPNPAKKTKYDHATIQKYASDRKDCIPFAFKSPKRL